jgi:hypothetical protein
MRVAFLGVAVGMLFCRLAAAVLPGDFAKFIRKLEVLDYVIIGAQLAAFWFIVGVLVNLFIAEARFTFCAGSS